jgi:hypothetical protein
VNSDAREEIAASVAAHAELGPRYESAVAEGLIERIGEEIDKRVDARLRGAGHAAPERTPPSPATPPLPPVAAAPAMPPYPAAHGVPGPLAGPAPYGPAPQPVPQGPARRAVSATVFGAILAVASMGLGVGATAVLSINLHNAGAAVVTILFVWAAIAMINAAHARFYWADDGTRQRRHHR